VESPGKKTFHNRIHIFHVASVGIVIAFLLGMGAVYRFNSDAQQKFLAIYSVYVPLKEALAKIREHLIAFQNNLQDIATLNAHSSPEELAVHRDAIQHEIHEIVRLLGREYATEGMIDLFLNYHQVALSLAKQMHTEANSTLGSDIQNVVLMRSLLEERLQGVEHYLDVTYQKDTLDAQNKMRWVTWTVFILILFLTATLTAASLIIVRLIVKRVNTLVEFAQEVSTGNYSIALNVQWNDEFATVAQALDSMVISINEKNAILHRLANFDALTELFNRNALITRLNAEIGAVRRHGYAMSFCICDIDNFKTINDRYGHLVGDQVLRAFAGCLRNILRIEDVVGRYGGDEFCVVLPHTPSAEAKLAMERVLQCFRTIAFIDDQQQTFSVTASFGICGFLPGMGTSDLIRDADAALYEAKKMGRNCVTTKT